MKEPTTYPLDKIVISENVHDSWKANLSSIAEQIEADLAAIGQTLEDIELPNEVFVHYGGAQGAIAVIMPYEIEGPDGQLYPRVFQMLIDRSRGDWTWFSGDVRDN